MKLTARLLLFALLGSFLYNACTDPTTLGADLFEEDQADILFTDTLTVKASTQLSDSVRTYTAAAFNQLDYYLFGKMVDPIFGTSTASIYLQPRLELINPVFANATADSLVLVLPYDTAGFYGNTDQEFEMEVYLLAEPFMDNTDYYSSDDLLTEPIPLASGVFRPYLDTTEVITFNSDGSADTVMVEPQLRLNLPLSFAQEMLGRSPFTYTSDTLFLEYIPGLYVRPVRETDGMVSFELNDNETGMFLYYKDSTGVLEQYQFEINSLSTYYESFEHDYAGTLVEAQLNDPQSGEDLTLVQGMAGVRTRVEIPYIENLKGLSVNKAELEISVASVEGDDPDTFEPLEDLVLIFEDGDEQRLVIDLAIASSTSTPLAREMAFGGVLEPREEGEPYVYRMNISSHIQEMINGVRPNTIYIAAFRRSEAAGRTTIIGPSDPIYGIKVNLAFTQL